MFLRSLTTQIISDHRTELGLASGRLDSPHGPLALITQRMRSPPSLLPLDPSKCIDCLQCSAVLPCTPALLTRRKVSYRHEMKVLDYMIKACLHMPKRAQRDTGRRGSPNNTLPWMLLSSSQESPAHHWPICTSTGSEGPCASDTSDWSSAGVQVSA